MEKETGEKYTIIQNVIDLKVNISMIRKMVLELSHGKVATFIMVIIYRTKEWDLERCIGLMVLYIKVNGLRVYNMAVE